MINTADRIAALPEPLPCPFCGSKNVEIRKKNDNRPLASIFWVECYLCEIGTKYHDSRNGAVRTWNARSNALIDQLTVDNASLKEVIREWYDKLEAADANIDQLTRQRDAAAKLSKHLDIVHKSQSEFFKKHSIAYKLNLELKAALDSLETSEK